MLRSSKTESHRSGIIVLAERHRASPLPARARVCGRDDVINQEGEGNYEAGVCGEGLPVQREGRQ